MLAILDLDAALRLTFGHPFCRVEVQRRAWRFCLGKRCLLPEPARQSGQNSFDKGTYASLRSMAPGRSQEQHRGMSPSGNFLHAEIPDSGFEVSHAPCTAPKIAFMISCWM